MQETTIERALANRQPGELGIKAKYGERDAITFPSCSEILGSQAEVDSARAENRKVASEIRAIPSPKYRYGEPIGSGAWIKHDLTQGKPYAAFKSFRMLLPDGSYWEGYASLSFLRVLRQDDPRTFFPLWKRPETNGKRRNEGKEGKHRIASLKDTVSLEQEKQLRCARQEVTADIMEAEYIEHGIRHCAMLPGLPLGEIPDMIHDAQQDCRHRLAVEALEGLIYNGHRPRGDRKEALLVFLRERMLKE